MTACRLSLCALAATMVLSAPILKADAAELELPTYQLQEGFGVWWKAAAEAFAEENPGHTIKLAGAPFGDHHNQLTTRFVAGNPPDIAHISARFMFGFADSGFLEPLDACLGEIDWKEEDFIAAQAQMRRDGHVYAQLLLGYGWGLFYNEAMMEDAGVAVPTTPQEFVAAAKALTRWAGLLSAKLSKLPRNVLPSKATTRMPWHAALSFRICACRRNTFSTSAAARP